MIKVLKFLQNIILLTLYKVYVFQSYHRPRLIFYGRSYDYITVHKTPAQNECGLVTYHHNIPYKRYDTIFEPYFGTHISTENLHAIKRKCTIKYLNAGMVKTTLKTLLYTKLERNIQL